MEITDFKNRLLDAIDIKQRIINNDDFLETIELVGNEIVTCYKNDGKLLFCGNGGSAADAQHLAAEFSGRYYIDRDPLFAEALHVNSSYVTAVANDYAFYQVYARLVKAFGREGDMLVAISTSGSSDNILHAIKTAKDIGMKIVGMTGESGGEMKNLCDFLINVPSADTPRIQEIHIFIGHLICEYVENKLFG